MKDFYSKLREIAVCVQSSEDQTREGFETGAKLARQEAINALESLRGELLAREWFSAEA